MQIKQSTCLGLRLEKSAANIPPEQMLESSPGLNREAALSPIWSPFPLQCHQSELIHFCGTAETMFLLGICFVLCCFPTNGEEPLRTNHLVGYFVGEFHRAVLGESFKFEAEFEATVTIDHDAQRIYTRITEVGQRSPSTLSLHPIMQFGSGSKIICPFGETCEIGIPPDQYQYFLIHVHKFAATIDPLYDILSAEMSTGEVNRTFYLHNPTGHCTNDQLEGSYPDSRPEPKNYRYCVCAGWYNPDPSLGCPVNPWTKYTTVSPSKEPFGIDCENKRTALDEIYCDKTWGKSPDDVPKVMSQTLEAFEPPSASRADVYELSWILKRVSGIKEIRKPDFQNIYEVYDKILGIEENVFWASNGEDAESTTRILDSVDILMSETEHDIEATNGSNVGFIRQQNVECTLKTQYGFADFGDRFGPADSEGYLAAIEIPTEEFCSEDGIPSPIFYAIYRNVNIFVPNSTSLDSKKSRLSQRFEENYEDTFDPELDPPNYDRCAVGYHQNRNRVLTASIYNVQKPAPTPTPTASLIRESRISENGVMAVMKFAKSEVAKSLHGDFLVSWWDGNRWSTEDTCQVEEKDGLYVAQCNHLTDFTILVDGSQTDPILCDTALSAVGYVTNGGSIIALAILNVFNALNYFTFLRDAILALIAVQLLKFKVDPLNGLYNIVLFLFYFFFTIFNDEERLGGPIGCQIVAAVVYWLLLCCIFLTLFQSWRILKLFAWTSEMEKVIAFITRPIVIILASVVLPTIICGLAVLANDFYDRKDQFCWINPLYTSLAVILPLSILLLNGLLCLFIILFRLYPDAVLFKPLRKLASVQTKVISSGQKNRARDRFITVAITSVYLGIPWAVQYLTLFAPSATVWHYIFTLVVGSQGIVLLAIFIFKRYQTHKRQTQVSTSSAMESRISGNTRPTPPTSVHYDSVPYEAARQGQPTARTPSILNRARGLAGQAGDRIRALPGLRRSQIPPPIPPLSTLPKAR